MMYLFIVPVLIIVSGILILLPSSSIFSTNSSRINTVPGGESSTLFTTIVTTAYLSAATNLPLVR
jgi:hypothetical protein